MANSEVTERANFALDVGWNGMFPIDPVAIASEITMVRQRDGARLPIRMEGQGLNGYSGYAKFVPSEGGQSEHFLCVFNTAEAPTRQRFTQAHELGHVMLGHVTKERSPRRDTSFNANAGDWDEIDANAFAAQLIMPEKYVRHLSSKIADISKLALEFGVSPWAIKVRLTNLGLL